MGSRNDLLKLGLSADRFDTKIRVLNDPPRNIRLQSSFETGTVTLLVISDAPRM